MITHREHRTTFASLPLLLALAACGPAAVTGVEVAVAPSSAQAVPGGTVTFAASVTGAVDGSVDWVVLEAGGGSVDASGAYTAPTEPGTYHVRASSKTKPAAQGQATVSVGPVAVAVAPATASIVAGGQVTFGAVVTGTSNPAVTWSVLEPGCGAVTAAGVYTGPAAAGTCHVIAASAAVPGKSGSATVTVAAPPVIPVVSVAVEPASAALDACRAVNLSAAVTGTSNGAVTWSVAEAAAGGSITSAGVYTAPATAGTYHAVAASQADPARTATATIVVSERVLAVALSPATVSVPQGGTAQFTATVTTSCGTTTAIRTVTAAGTL